MDFTGGSYYELNRILLLSIGLWPYDESILKRVKMLVTVFFVVTFVFGMMAKIVTSKYDSVITLKVLSLCAPGLLVIVKYITFLLLPASIKKLMELVKSDWNSLKDVKEIEIIRRYSYFGRLCTIIIVVFGYTCVSGLLIIILLPDILDIVAPLNVSRQRRLPVDVDYFVDQETHFKAILCHLYIAIVVSVTTVLATESLYVAYVHHACGMFKIASYRMQHAFALDSQRVSSCVKSETIHAKISAAIEIHNRALQFYDFLWSNLATSYFILILIGVVSLSINLYRVFQALVTTRDIDELLTSTIFVFGHFVYIFCGNYAGQVFIDHSTGVHENVCDTKWYRVPLQQQKLMLFILNRSMQSCKLVTGGTFVLSLEGFTTLLATSISYFTVLSSVQN